MTVIYINLTSGTQTAGAPWSYNEFNSGATSVGTLSADLKDDSNVSTGIGLEVTSVFSGVTGSTSQATAGAGGWPEEVFESDWYTNGTATLQLTGLTDGDSYSIEVAGHASDAARDSDFTIGGTTTRYDSAGTGAPNAPITFSGTVSGTTLDIDTAVVSTFGYINGLKITITNAPSTTTVGLYASISDSRPTRTSFGIATAASGGRFTATAGDSITELGFFTHSKSMEFVLFLARSDTNLITHTVTFTTPASDPPDLRQSVTVDWALEDGVEYYLGGMPASTAGLGVSTTELASTDTVRQSSGLTYPPTVGDDVAPDSYTGATSTILYATLTPAATGPTSETATTGNIPLVIQSGYTLVDLVDPVTTNASLLFGVTGDAPVTGDHLEYDVTSVLDSGVTLSVAATGVWTVTEAVDGDWTTDITVSRRVVQADGTIGTEAVLTLEAPTGTVTSLATSENEKLIEHFRSVTGLSTYSLNELAIAYYKQVGSTGSPQFNEALKAAQDGVPFKGLGPTDWRN